MSRKEGMNWNKTVHEIEFEENRKASAERRAKDNKRAAEKEKQLQENRKGERTVILEGGAPQ